MAAYRGWGGEVTLVPGGHTAADLLHAELNRDPFEDADAKSQPPSAAGGPATPMRTKREGGAPSLRAAIDFVAKHSEHRWDRKTNKDRHGIGMEVLADALVNALASGPAAAASRSSPPPPRPTGAEGEVGRGGERVRRRGEGEGMAETGLGVQQRSTRGGNRLGRVPNAQMKRSARPHARTYKRSLSTAVRECERARKDAQAVAVRARREHTRAIQQRKDDLLQRLALEDVDEGDGDVAAGKYDIL